MANHIREQIRNGVVTQLTGLATTGSHVFDARVRPLQESELPCLLVGTQEDETEYLTAGINPTILWNIALSVRVVVKQTGAIEHVIDNICTEVLQALAADHTIGGLAKGFARASSSLEFDGEGEQKVGIRTVLFQVQAMTRETTPDVALT